MTVGMWSSCTWKFWLSIPLHSLKNWRYSEATEELLWLHKFQHNNWLGTLKLRHHQFLCFTSFFKDFTTINLQPHFKHSHALYPCTCSFMKTNGKLKHFVWQNFNIQLHQIGNFKLHVTSNNNNGRGQMNN